MQVATIKLHLGKDQTVERNNVTPAEAAFYVAEHRAGYGKCPVELVGAPTEIERTSKQEIERLYTRLPLKKIKMLYPNTLANVPDSFEAAFEVGMEMSFPSGSLMEFDAAKV